MADRSTHPTIDLRSDTRTRPDKEVRAAMATAVVGDDSFGDDPTVRTLEDRATELLGMPAALFTCGGTMSNVLAVLAAAGPGVPLRVVAGTEAHLLHYENDGVRLLARAEVDAVTEVDGVPVTAAVVEALARSGPGTRQLWLENSANRAGGNAMSVSTTAQLVAIARAAGAHTHLDGARLPNAAVTHGQALHAMVAGASTVAISLCKGLGAPAGSILAADHDTIGRARHLRRMVGGTMHQTGLLAAAGLVALGRVTSLAEDHRRAADLRDRLVRGGDVSVEQVPHPTNMVFLRVADTTAEAFVESLARAGVLALPIDETRVRLVVHRDHCDSDMAVAAERIATAVRDRSPEARHTS